MEKESKDIILIYQMGKVASTSIKKAAEHSKLDGVTLFNTHFLSKKRIMLEDEFSRANTLAHARVAYAKTHLERVREFQGALRNSLSGRKQIKIITAVRDPITHAFSNFFQNINTYYPLYSQMNDLEEVAELLSDLFLRLLRKSIADNLNLNTVIGKNLSLTFGASRWFDQDFKPALDIDIYEKPFDKKNGFINYKQDGFDIFVYRFENLHLIYDEIEKFLTPLLEKNLDINNFNSGDQKKYSILYKNFKDKLKVSDDLLEEINNTKYYQHFYA